MRGLAKGSVGAPSRRAKIVAQRVLRGGAEHRIVFVAEDEEVLDAFAEGGDARVVHAHARLAECLRHLGQQAGAIAAHQRQLGGAGHLGKLDLRRAQEMPQAPRQAAPGDALGEIARVQHAPQGSL